MQDFHLIRARNALPFLRHLQAHGALLEALALETGLPLDAVQERPEGVMGEYALWRFIELGSELAGLPHLGYDSAEASPLQWDSKLGDIVIRHGSSLQQTLQNFCEDVMFISTASYYGLRREPESAWFHRAQAFGGAEASWQAEQYTLAILLQIVRLYAGPEWLPVRIRISSLPRHTPLPPAWGAISVEWGSKATEIEIPAPVLALPPPEKYASGASRRSRAALRPTFEQLVETQLASGCSGIENAARQTGLSVSTLQRRLREMGTSYREILDQVRFQQACQMLRHTERPVAVIAEELGYRHLGNFSRSFLRLSGVPPQAYRIASLPGETRAMSRR
jgi:AraC-like DNA-binding protein